ncbi:RNA polymerase sigma factor [Sulfidibacter corallicola]|uniref:RNA polymerase sigma factor n=1 Tax=Sulfidibacter corallicola TaxID=2818388 RepID=A0A8A4TIL5_SULCO|nr:RNA polymerase sigma factor [Sulfidibacter corallicola]QTD48992.1 RNA polymerase sigma factor [Sulfidibacter corallicola]
MTKAARGDDSAFAALVDRCQAGLIQYLTLMCGDPPEAEDLAQEVFVRLYRRRAHYEPVAKLKTYLYHIARNLLKDRYRRKHRRGADISLEAPDPQGVALSEKLVGDRPDPHHLEKLSLYDLIGKLPEGQRDVLLLNSVEQLTYPEIAQILEIPIGTVKTRMFFAVRKCRELLGR